MYISRQLGINILFVLSVNDIVNVLLKWILLGDRPYWYSIYVREFNSTCESGYGLPSGHTAINTAIYTIILYHYWYKSNPRIYKRVLCSMVIVIPLIAWSRIHTGAHFVGQTIYGILSGYIITTITHKYSILQSIELRLNNIMNGQNRSMVTISTISLLSSVSIIIFAYIELYILSLFDIDSLHSVVLKSQGCGNYRVADRYKLINNDIISMMQSNDNTMQHSSNASSMTHANTPVMAVVRDSGLFGSLILYLCINIIRLNNNTQYNTVHVGNDTSSNTTLSYNSILSTDTVILQLSIKSIVITYIQLCGLTYILSYIVTLISSYVSSDYYMLTQYILNYIEFILITLFILIIIPSVTRSVCRQ